MLVTEWCDTYDPFWQHAHSIPLKWFEKRLTNVICMCITSTFCDLFTSWWWMNEILKWIWFSFSLVALLQTSFSALNLSFSLPFFHLFQSNSVFRKQVHKQEKKTTFHLNTWHLCFVCCSVFAPFFSTLFHTKFIVIFTLSKVIPNFIQTLSLFVNCSHTCDVFSSTNQMNEPFSFWRF